MSEVVAVCTSARTGERKIAQDEIVLRVGHGIEGDAHAGAWHRQVSLLADEAVDALRERGIALAAGDFAENILTRGIDLPVLPVGSVLAVGECLLAVTQIGKECHGDCEIKRRAGMCVMPTCGIFCVVLRGGCVRAGDPISAIGEGELL
ncbi:MOSC domain-containing protein [Coriobacteriales bacterium OH1046]|nr:MOSC domain-containing protein [Coriobacteriales bacterium OH1046]